MGCSRKVPFHCPTSGTGWWQIGFGNTPRKGLPAPWVAEKWKDPEWAVAQICGREDCLSVDQVRAIRELAKGHPVEEISSRIGARNVEQVRRVLDGKTYTRVV
jgi:hypothetical protein